MDEHRAQLMAEWTLAMEQQHLTPICLLGVDIDDPTNTALMVVEGIDDGLLAITLAELSRRMRRAAAASSRS